MTEEQLNRGLNLIKLVGIFVTVLFFAAALAFTVVLNGLPNSPQAFSILLPYVIGITIVIAILFVAVYFIYRAVQTGRVTKA